MVFPTVLSGSQCGRAGAAAESKELTARRARLLTLASNLHTRCQSPQAGQSNAGGKIHADQETDHEDQAFEESQEARSDQAAIKSELGWTWHRTSVRWGRPSDHSLRRAIAETVNATTTVQLKVSATRSGPEPFRVWRVRVLTNPRLRCSQGNSPENQIVAVPLTINVKK